MRKVLNSAADVTKIMVSVRKLWLRPLRHARLQEQMARNRGRAIGLPARHPSAWVERRARERGQKKMRLTNGGCPF